jgi:putative component of membrane protein insertase Oxa1/YidC/SpoIIIJ protein YidD
LIKNSQALIAGAIRIRYRLFSPRRVNAEGHLNLKDCYVMRNIPWTIFTGLVCLLLPLGGTALADPPVTQAPGHREAEPMMTAPVRLFQTYLSGADGQRCPMHPSCSAYALQAMRRHGSMMGWIMTCDRLMRCGRDELRISPPVNTPQGVRCRDPLDNNDFWIR